MPQHAASIRLRGVAAARKYADIGKGFAGGAEHRSELVQRRQKIAPNVVVERSQRGDIEDTGVSAGPGAGDEPIDGPQKGGQGLAAARRRRDEDVLAVGDTGPGLLLSCRWHPDALGEPGGHQRVEEPQRTLLTVRFDDDGLGV